MTSPNLIRDSNPMIDGWIITETDHLGSHGCLATVGELNYRYTVAVHRLQF